MNATAVPAVLRYVAERGAYEMRKNGAPEPITIEISFTRDALRQVGARRPALLRLTALAGLDVSFPEEALDDDTTLGDWCVRFIAMDDNIEYGLLHIGRLDQLWLT